MKDSKAKAFNIIKNYIGGCLYLSGCDLKGITLPTTIGSSLYLSGCDLKGITLPTTIGGSLDLSGCDLKGTTLPTTIGSSLYLSGCDLKGTTLPTTIGGSLDLSGCENVPNGVYNCGNENRTIAVYDHPEKGLVVSLGCFIGTQTEAIQAIKYKYGANEQCEGYCEKINYAFYIYLENSYG